MENEKSFKIVSICALLVGVVGLTLGFAAYTNTLTIKSSASVKPTATKLDVTLQPTEGTGTTVSGVAEGGATAGDATINNSGANPTIEGLAATFTAPGQSVTYTFNAKGDANYIAYLSGIDFGTAKSCTAGTGATASLVTAACNGISIKASVGGKEYTTTTSGITGSSIAKAGTAPIVVTITYAAGSEVADGPFTVAFGDIVLSYTSAPTA